MALLKVPESLTDPYAINFKKFDSSDGTSIYTFGHPSGTEWAYDEGYISLKEKKLKQQASNGSLIEVESYRIRSMGITFMQL